MNILYSVTDSNYLGLTAGLIRSLSEHEPGFEKLAIGVMGLGEAEARFLRGLDSRVELMELASPDESEILHDEGWVSRTLQKTIGLREMLRLGHRVIMLDADCIVLRPILLELEGVAGVGVCRRERPAVRKDIRLDYIASLFVGYGEKALGFVDLWILIQKKLIEAKIQPPFETPALCRAIRYCEPSLIEDIDESVFSRQNSFAQDTRIAHLKSNSIEKTSDVLKSRLNCLNVADRNLLARYY